MGIFKNSFQSVISYGKIAENFIANINQLPFSSLLTLMEESSPSDLPRDSYKLLADHLGLRFNPDQDEELEERASPVCYAQRAELREGFEIETYRTAFTPIDFLDYIYAIFHSPSYRKKYGAFLKEDFPQIPYPNTQKDFWELVRLGNEIRRAHLLEPSKVGTHMTTYPIKGSNTITCSMGKDSWKRLALDNQRGRVWINDKQYFDRVPLVAWEFCIDGCLPAQQWLEDREGQKLSPDDILHFHRVVVALTETARLMKVIGEIQAD